MNLPAFKVRYLRKILQWPIDGFEITIEEARKGLEYLGPRKRSDKIKAWGRAARAEKQTKQKSRREKSRELHDKVMRRPGWACELGEHESMSLLSFIQVHHLKAGSAKRHTEALHNLIRACDVDHRLWHSKGPEFYRAAVGRWCKQHGYPMPSVYTRRAA